MSTRSRIGFELEKKCIFWKSKVKVSLLFRYEWKTFLSVCQKDPFNSASSYLSPSKIYSHNKIIPRYTNTITWLPFLPIGASRLFNSTLELWLETFKNLKSNILSKVTVCEVPRTFLNWAWPPSGFWDTLICIYTGVDDLVYCDEIQLYVT